MKAQELVLSNRIGCVSITNGDCEKPPCEMIRDTMFNMITNDLSNYQCSIQIFNGHKNDASNTTNVSNLCNFDVAKIFFRDERTKYLHIYIQGINNASFRKALPSIINNNNSNVAKASIQPTMAVNSSEGN